MPKVRDEFPLEFLKHNYWRSSHTSSLKFIGNYKDYNNVFAIHWLFGKEKNNIVNAMKEQEIYLVIDENDEFKLVDASSLRDYEFNKEKIEVSNPYR